MNLWFLLGSDSQIWGFFNHEYETPSDTYTKTLLCWQEMMKKYCGCKKLWLPTNSYSRLPLPTSQNCGNLFVLLPESLQILYYLQQ